MLSSIVSFPPFCYGFVFLMVRSVLVESITEIRVVVCKHAFFIVHLQQAPITGSSYTAPNPTEKRSLGQCAPLNESASWFRVRTSLQAGTGSTPSSARSTRRTGNLYGPAASSSFSTSPARSVHWYWKTFTDEDEGGGKGACVDVEVPVGA